MLKGYDITGQKFYKLLVLEFSHLGTRNHKHWKCLCDCGNEKIASTRNLKSGKVKSCGCFRKSSLGEKWKGKGYLCQTFFSRIKRDSLTRDLEFSITLEDAQNLFNLQEGKCALTGIDIDFGKGRKDSNRTASLDRIDSSKGYTVDNIQWLHKQVNVMKWDLSTERLLELSKAIVLYNDL